MKEQLIESLEIMKRQTQTDDITFFSFQKDLKGYKKEALYADFFAALTVAMLTLPQAMAYAMLASLPISCGIFAAIYSALIASIFGSSRHLIVGPSNAMAILVQAGTSEIIFTFYRDIGPEERQVVAVQILTSLTLLVGFFQVMAAGLKLGRLSQFISHSVIAGYVMGTTIAVVINQVFTLAGIPRMPGVHSLYERGIYLLMHLHEFHTPTALIGIFSLILIVALKRFNKRLPAAFIALFVSAAFVYAANYLLNIFFEGGDVARSLYSIELVGDTGILPDIIPRVELPYFDMREINALLPTAFAIAVLSVMETSSAAKSVASSSGQRLSSNQEIFGIGLGNLTSSLISGMPISGSPSRSLTNYKNGAKTRVSAILNVFFVMIILMVFHPMIALVPLPSLASLLLITSISVVNKNQILLCLKSTRSDALVLAMTFLSCIFFSFDVAFYIGVGMSITLYLKKAAIPQLMEFEVDDAGELKPLSHSKNTVHKSIRVIKVEGELFFGAADLFQSTLKAIAEDDTHTKVIILQLKNARDIDATVCLALQQLHDYLKNSERHLLASGLTPAIWDVLNDSGLIESIGKDNLFAFDERHPYHYMHKAIQRAKELIALSQKEEEKDSVEVEEETIIGVQDPIS